MIYETELMTLDQSGPITVGPGGMPAGRLSYAVVCADLQKGGRSVRSHHGMSLATPGGSGRGRVRAYV